MQMHTDDPRLKGLVRGPTRRRRWEGDTRSSAREIQTEGPRLREADNECSTKQRRWVADDKIFNEAHTHGWFTMVQRGSVTPQGWRGTRTWMLTTSSLHSANFVYELCSCWLWSVNWLFIRLTTNCMLVNLWTHELVAAVIPLHVWTFHCCVCYWCVLLWRRQRTTDSGIRFSLVRRLL